MDHKAMDRVTVLPSGRYGYLCSCGRTIIGQYQIDEHFVGVPMKTEGVHFRRMEGKLYHVVPPILAKAFVRSALRVMMGEGHG